MSSYCWKPVIPTKTSKIWQKKRNFQPFSYAIELCHYAPSITRVTMFPFYIISILNDNTDILISFFVYLSLSLSLSHTHMRKYISISTHLCCRLLLSALSLTNHISSGLSLSLTHINLSSSPSSFFVNILDLVLGLPVNLAYVEDETEAFMLSMAAQKFMDVMVVEDHHTALRIYRKGVKALGLNMCGNASNAANRSRLPSLNGVAGNPRYMVRIKIF